MNIHGVTSPAVRVLRELRGTAAIAGADAGVRKNVRRLLFSRPGESPPFPEDFAHTAPEFRPHPIRYRLPSNGGEETRPFPDFFPSSTPTPSTSGGLVWCTN
jgi:hypothetical protein